MKKKIPEGWTIKRIEELFDVQLGKMLSEKARQGEQFPYLANFNVRWGTFDLHKLNTMHFSEREKQKYKLINGDLIMCEGGEIGRCAVWKINNPGIYYQKALHRIRSKDGKSSTDYLCNYMRYTIDRGELVKIVGETSIAHLTREKLLRVSLPLPPLAEQKAIADLLSVWDQAIEKTERLIERNEKRLNGLYQHYFIPKHSINNHWEKVKIGHVLNQRKTTAIPTDDRPLFSLTIEDGVTEKTNRYNREALVKDAGSKKYKIVCPDDIVFNPANLRWGAIARSKAPHEVVVSPIYEVLSIKNKAFDIDFISHLLTCPRQIQIYATKTEGTLIERMAVKIEAFLLIDIFLPPTLEEQRQIAETLSTAQKEIDLLKKLVEKYKLQKRGLMQKMLTGERRVKGEVVERYREG